MSITPTRLPLKAVLIAAGPVIVVLAILFLQLHHGFEGDSTRRYNAIRDLLEEGKLSDMAYSMVGPIFSIPMFLLGKIVGSPAEWILRYNFVLFALGLLVINHLLKDQLSVPARRHFFLILILGSMFPNHLRAYTAETFTAITVIIGILAIVSGKYVGLGSAAIILGVANTPGAMVGLGLVALALCLSERKWRYLLVPVMAGALILVEAWIRRGWPFTTGYENNAGFKTFMPYSGLPGFSYPLLFGLLSILFSFGKGILFFAPGMFLPQRQEHSPGKPEVRKIHLLCLLFVAGLVLLYAKWWSWYGGWFWGPRFFLFASIPASLALALRLESRNQSILGDFLTLLALALSFWVGINGAVFGQDGLGFLANNNYAFESFVWYIPEYSVLWWPLVELRHFSLREYSLIALIIIVFIYLAAPPAYRLARSFEFLNWLKQKKFFHTWVYQLEKYGNNIKNNVRCVYLGKEHEKRELQIV